jgi:hypothetical protein
MLNLMPAPLEPDVEPDVMLNLMSGSDPELIQPIHTYQDLSDYLTHLLVASSQMFKEAVCCCSLRIRNKDKFCSYGALVVWA